MPKNAKLTAKQKRFADEWLLSMNATDAAKKAGFSKKTAESQGSRLLRNVKVKEYIEKRRKESEELLGFSKNTMLKDLLSAKDRCLQAIPVMEFVDGEWVHNGEWKFDSKGAIAAINQVCKMMGYNEPEKLDMTSGGERVGKLQYIVPKPDNGKDASAPVTPKK